MGFKRLRAGAVFLVLTTLAVLACGTHDAPSREAEASAVAPTSASTGDLAADATAPGARVALPLRAVAPFRITDASSGMFVEVGLVGARDVAAAQLRDRTTVYRAAHARGGDVSYRVLPDGVEDFVAFDTRPDIAEVLYDVALGSSVAGLRLVGGVLEMLDAGGAPRLRVAKPYVMGADGARKAAALSVRGCRVDTDPRGPWGRAVVPPGAPRCTVRVTWDARSVAHPALVDPLWSTTGKMSTPRSGHTAGLFTVGPLKGKVMVVGGESLTVPDGTFDPAGPFNRGSELYDPLSRTWASTGGLSEDHLSGSVTWLADGRVLTAGGSGGVAASVYDPAAGTWASTGNLAAVRQQHTASLLPNGKVLVACGVTDNMPGPGITTTEIYDPMKGMWGAGPPTSSAHVSSSATTLADGRVLLVGGARAVAGMLDAATELFDPASGMWTTIASPAIGRVGHTATLLASGRVLLAGGRDGGGIPVGSTERFDAASGKWATVGSLPVSVSGHAAVAQAPGRALLTGGRTVTPSPGSVNRLSSIFDDATGNWTGIGSLAEGRSEHTATLIAPGIVLIAGGGSFGAALTSAEVFQPGAPGAACEQTFDCASGFCAEKICCDTACTGVCNACTAIKKGSGADGTCGPAGGSPCNGYACTPAGDCKTSCGTDPDCASGFTCSPAAKMCLPASGAKCIDSVTLESPGGAKTPCSPFVCEGSACKTTCSSVNDCVAPFVCSRDLQCVSLGGNSDGGGSGACAASPATSRGALAGIAALFAALALALRGRRRDPR